MSSFQVPEEVLHDILSEVIDQTKSTDCSSSLRLVNHQFNEALLHVYFLRKKLRPDDYFVPKVLYRATRDRRQKDIYLARFSFQSLLKTRNLAEDSQNGQQLLRRWEAALTMLQDAESIKWPNGPQALLYSTCSNSTTFNHFPSAILAEAIRSYMGHGFLTILADYNLRPYRRFDYHTHIVSFWVVLSACVLGDLQVCETHMKDFMGRESSSISSPGSRSDEVQQFLNVLTVAVEHAHLHIVRRLFEIRPNILLETSTYHRLLQRAIFAGNNDILRVLLSYTPKSPEMLMNAMHREWRSSPYWPDGGVETIRLLVSHFAPFSPRVNDRLIVHACAVGDVSLLAELCTTEYIPNHPIERHIGRYPTYVLFAIRCGNFEALRFLLDRYAVEDGQIKWTDEVPFPTLTSSQLECFLELRRRYSTFRAKIYFFHLATIAGTEEIISSYLQEHGAAILERPSYSDPEIPNPSTAEYALEGALHWLRPGNLQCILELGVRPFPWSNYKARLTRRCWLLPNVDDSFAIPWSHFNSNRAAFERIQELLDAYGLPKLRVIV